MMGSVQFASLADCPHCRVQGAVVETWDSATPGTPIASRCRMCIREVEAGVEAKPARALLQLKDVSEALARWAHEEGFASVEEFVASAFVLGTLPAVHTALIVGDPIETSFDVMGFLFSHVGGDTPGVAADDKPAALVESKPAPAAALTAIGSRPLAPQNEILALASVAAADGVVLPIERAFLDDAARSKGVVPLADEAVRVYRADEVGPVGGLLDRERVLEKMVELAFVDGELDESERRVIKGFARAWGVDPARVDAWLAAWSVDAAPLFQRLVKRAARWLFPEA
jgi:tellurite resistance protein